MPKPKHIDKIVEDIARLQEHLSPTSDMAIIGEFTTKKIREHLRELTAIVADLAIEVKEIKLNKRIAALEGK